MAPSKNVTKLAANPVYTGANGEDTSTWGSNKDKRVLICNCGPRARECVVGVLIKQREQRNGAIARCSGCNTPWMDIASKLGCPVHFRNDACRARFGLKPYSDPISKVSPDAGNASKTG